MAKWKGERSKSDLAAHRESRAVEGERGSSSFSAWYLATSWRSSRRELIWSNRVKCCIQLRVGYQAFEEKSSISVIQMCLPNCDSGRVPCTLPRVKGGVNCSLRELLNLAGRCFWRWR